MDKGKVGVAVGFLFISVYVLFEISTRFAEAGVVGGRPDSNAALFPMVTAILLLLVTSLWILQMIRANRSSRPAGPREAEGAPLSQESEVTAESSKPTMQSFWTLIILIVYILFVNVVGYLVSTPFALTAMFYVLGVRKPLIAFGIAVITTFAFYYLFGGLMSILLPVGRFGWYI